MNTSRKGFIVPLILILVAIFFIGGGSYAYLETKPNQPAAINSNAQATSTIEGTQFPIIETGYTWDNEYRKRPDGSQELYKSFLLFPLGKRISVPDIASSRLDGNRLLLANPLDQQKIISLTHDSFNEGENMIRIESYDLNTNEFTLLYTINGFPFGPDRVLEIVGTQSSKVIFHYSKTGRGGCVHGGSWDDTPENFTYLDLNNPTAGLKAYVVPVNMIQQAEASYQKCLSDWPA